MANSKKLKILSYAKVQATTMAFIGLIAGVLYAGGGAIYESFTNSLNSGTALAFLALAGMPILFAAFGFVTAVIGASLYNVTSRWFGGVDLSIGREN